jgi:hypothetical protein
MMEKHREECVIGWRVEQVFRPVIHSEEKSMFNIQVLGAVAAMIAVSSSAQAQTGSAAGNTVGDFTLERVLTLAGIIAPAVPNIPAPVLAGIQSGALDVHQVFAYNSAQRTLEQTTFLVPGNSPLPFPSPGAATLVDHYIIQIDSDSTTSSPGASAVLAGHVTSNDAPTPSGNITGAIVTLSFGYRGSAAATQFGPVIESVSGLYSVYTATGVGSLAANATPQKCSLANLNGAYLFRVSGYIQAGANAFGPSFGPYVDNGRFLADGNGNITVVDSGSINGSVFSNRSYALAYTLDSNCLGSAKGSGIAAGISLDIQVSKDGRNMNLVFTQPSSVVASGNGQLQ